MGECTVKYLSVTNYISYWLDLLPVDVCFGWFRSINRVLIMCIFKNKSCCHVFFSLSLSHWSCDSLFFRRSCSLSKCMFNCLAITHIIQCLGVEIPLVLILWIATGVNYLLLQEEIIKMKMFIVFKGNCWGSEATISSL